MYLPVESPAATSMVASGRAMGRICGISAGGWASGSFAGFAAGDVAGDQDAAVRWRRFGLVKWCAGGGPAFRAIDKKTGKILHELKLNGVTSGTPMTYLWKGKQYIVIATTNRTEGAELAALTLGN